MEIKLTKTEIIRGNTYSVSDYNVFYKTGDKHIFENVILDLMLKLYGGNDDLYLHIHSLPIEDRIISILLLLEDNNALWDKLFELIKGNKVSKIDHLKDVIKLIRKFIKIADVERKKHGEIMTPLDELARPMVELVPPEFWTDHTKKILDSSAGIGTFLIICAAKLMNGLKDWEPDEEKRFKHIVENMLYYGELQSRNAFLWLCIINPLFEHKTNTYWGSTLGDEFNNHIKNVWKVSGGFDLNIQNPPYQEQQEGYEETQPLWHKFVKSALSHTKENGYMVMVHPSGWRNVDGAFKDIQNLLKSKQLIEISSHDEREGEKMFGATTGYDYYILKNSTGKIKTKISSTTSKGEMDLSNLEFIPSDMFDVFAKLIAGEGEDTINLLHNYSYEHRKKFISKEKTDEFKYPVVYTIQKDETINLRYSSVNNLGHFGVSKVIWSNGKASSPIIDMDGEYAMTGFAYAIIDEKENLPKIKQAMNTSEFVKLMKSCDMNDGNRFNKRILSLFRKDFWKEFI